MKRGLLRLGCCLSALLSGGQAAAQPPAEPTIGEAQSFFMTVMAPNARITIKDNDWIPEKFFFTKIQLEGSHPCIFAASINAAPNFSMIFGFKFEEIEKVQPFLTGEDIEPFSSGILLTGNMVYGTDKNPKKSHSILLRLSTRGMRDRALHALLFMQQRCAIQQPF